MVIVHHLNNSRSQRILWLLEELGAPYEIRPYQRDATTNLAPESLKAAHPLGKSPVIEYGPIKIAESGAIVDYLIRAYGQGRLAPPAGGAEHEAYLEWLHYAEGSAMPPLLMKLVFSVLPDRAPWFVKPIVKGISDTAQKTFIDPQLKLHADYWEAELGKAAWFAGNDFTGADVQMSFPLEAAAMRAGLGSAYPKIAAFLQTIHARPAYKRALEKGGPYAFAG